MKRGKKTLLLLAALGVLVGAYYLTKALTKEPEVADTKGSYEIAAVTADTLTEMSWKNGDDTITLKKTDAGWAYAPDETFPLNQDKAGEMADSLAALKGTRELTGDMKLSDYGLETPAFTVSVKTADAAYTYQMGDKTTLTSEYYVKLADKDAIYTVSKSLSDIFSASLNDLAVMPSIPAIGDATSLTIGEAVNQTYDTAQGVWKRAGTEELSATASVTDLIDKLKNLTFKSIVSWKADAAALATYGLDKPTEVVVASAVTQADASVVKAVFELEIGSAGTDGVYARLKDSDIVCLIDSSAASALTGATDDSLRDMTVLAVTFDNMRAVTLTAGGATAELSCTVTQTQSTTADAQAADAAKTQETRTYTLNGAQTDADTAATLYSALSALKGTGIAVSRSGAETTVLTAAVTDANGNTQTITLNEYDADNYVLDSACERRLLVSADTVDSLARKIKNIK